MTSFPGKSNPNYRHGKAGTKVHTAWMSMKRRLKVNPFYKDITICREWLESFNNFYTDMGDPPENTSLDRIDNTGNYCKENCRWANDSLSRHNKRYSKKSNLPRGVSPNRYKFKACIKIQGINYVIGNFHTPEEAHEAYKKMCIEWYGTYKDY